MNKFTLNLLAASALCAVGAAGLSAPAFARDTDGVSVSVTFGGAAFGYDDGYYDNDRRWHQWRDDDERAWYQRNHSTTYYGMSRYDDRDSFRRDWRDGRRADWRDDRRVDFVVSLGNVQFGYEDGYYDNSRRWHSWRSDDERRWYQQHRGPTYFQMGRYEDNDNYRRAWRDGRRADWRGGDVDFAIVLGNVVFAYEDGYYDNSRRWHSWRNDNERRWYQQNHRDSYFHMSRYRDSDRNRRDWRYGRRADWRGTGDVGFSVSLGNIVFGYSDGYYDSSRRWHTWRNDNERRWYQQNRRQSYYHMSRERDRDRNRRDWRDGRRNDWRPSS